MNPESKRNIKIGIFALMSIAVVCLGLNYLKGREFFSSGMRLTAYFAEVDGLTDSSPVLYHGYKVGAVRGIDIDQYAEDPSRLFCVSVGLEKHLDVPADSRLVIISDGLLGGKALELHIGKSSDLVGNGDEIATGVKGGMFDELLPMKDQASAVMTSADAVLRDLDTVLSGGNRAQLDAAIRSFSLAMKNMEAVTRNLDALTRSTGAVAGTFSSTNGLMQTLDAQKPRIDSLMRNLVSLSDGLSRANFGGAVSGLDSLSSSLNGLLASDGNIARLAKDDRIYENLADVTENLNRLLVDLRLNPSRYINISAFKFGGKQVYFSDVNTAADVFAGSVYVVCIAEGRQPKDMPTSISGKGVLEYHAGKKYKYLINPFDSQAEADAFVRENSLLSTYPSAVVEHYENGEQK